MTDKASRDCAGTVRVAFVCESRLRRLDDARYEYTPKKGVTFTLTAEALVRRLLALLPPARLHLTSFHGVLAPNASLRPLATQKPDAPAVSGPRAKVPPLEKDEAAPRLGHPPPAHLRHRRAALPLRRPPYYSGVALHPQRRRAETDCPWHAPAGAHSPAGHRTSPSHLRRLTDSTTLSRLRPPESTCVDSPDFSRLRRPNSLARSLELRTSRRPRTSAFVTQLPMCGLKFLSFSGSREHRRVLGRPVAILCRHS